MKAVIVTMKGINYGNRLQNYAVYRFLERLSLQMENFYINDLRKQTVLKKEKNIIKRLLKKTIPMPLLKWNWYRKSLLDFHMDSLKIQKEHIFDMFTKEHMKSEYITLYHDNDIKKYIKQNKYCNFVAGSDQIWNPDFAGDDYFFLDFIEPNKRIAFAASIGYETLPDDVLERYTKYWKQMRYISVREQSAADLIEKATGRKVDVFLDPTMLLTQAEWKEIEEKPNFKLPEQYILCLFLGNAPSDIIEGYKREYGIEVVMLNDKSYPDYYLVGPSEFVYLIEHADLVLTDSFHCTVFSIIFHRDFYVFERESDTLKNMFTRLENLLDKMGFWDRVQKQKRIIQKEKIVEERFERSDAVMREEQKRVTRIIAELLQYRLKDTE